MMTPEEPRPFLLPAPGPGRAGAFSLPEVPFASYTCVRNSPLPS